MKNSNKLLPIIAILTLSACQAGKVTSEKITSIAAQSIIGEATNNSEIDLGNLQGGVDLKVQSNATPTPTPGSGGGTGTGTGTGGGTEGGGIGSIINRGAFFIFAQFTSLFTLDAQAAQNGTNTNTWTDTWTSTGTGTSTSTSTSTSTGTSTSTSTATTTESYQFYTSTNLVNRLGSVVGAELATYQNLYQNYAAALANNSATPIPTVLQRAVNVSFVSVKGETSKLVLPLVSIFAANAAVITYGTSAYYGIGLIPSANATIPATPLWSLTKANFLRVGSNLKVIGGSSGGGVINKNVATITFTGSYFTVNTISSLTTDPAVAKIVVKPINSALATSAGLASTYVANYIVVAHVNSLSKILSFNLLNLNTGVITSGSSIDCANVISYFTGYTCP